MCLPLLLSSLASRPAADIRALQWPCSWVEKHPSSLAVTYGTKRPFLGHVKGPARPTPLPKCDVRRPLGPFLLLTVSLLEGQSPELLSAPARMGTPWFSRSGQNLKYKTGNESASRERKGGQGLRTVQGHSGHLGGVSREGRPWGQTDLGLDPSTAH